MTHIERKIRRKAIANYIDAGHSISVTCKKYGITYNMVVNACRENNVTVDSGRLSLTVLELYKLLKMLVDKVSLADISNEFEITAARAHQLKQIAKESGWLS